MPYQFQNVNLWTPNSDVVSNNSTLGIAAPFTCCVMSAWFTYGIIHPAASFALSGNFLVTVQNDRVGFSTTNGTQSVGTGNSISGPVFNLGEYANVLISIDVANKLVSAYANDQPYDFSVLWFGSAVPRQITNAVANWFVIGSGCVGDVWFGPTASYVDLSIASNRRKFINADLTPVSLGADGSAPFGTQPPIFLHIDAGGVATDFLTNLGSGGSFIAHGPGSIGLGACGVYPPTVPSNDTITVGDLWYGPTGDTFVDLRAESNRRKFVGLDGSTQWLGDDGSEPFGDAPPIFLTRSPGEQANNWPDNEGAGGVFTRAGNDLQIATDIPPCAPYTVPITINPNTPQGADPEIRLAVSDDGGRTFSLLQKWRSMGKIGQYRKRLRWMKMGMFRQRQIRLEVTDPVRRNIIGIYMDVSQGLDW